MRSLRALSLATAFLLMFVCLPASAARVRTNSDAIMSYSFSFRNQYGVFLRSPYRLASNRFLVDATQVFKPSPVFTLVASGRIAAEAAYAANADDFTTEQARKDSSEVSLRDAYLQYKQDAFVVRLGNQQVVWGEAFGFFFSDIVNPKDLRESSLYGLFEMSDLRTPAPFFNGQWRGDDWSIQFLYGFLPVKHRMPRIGGPYSPKSFSRMGLSVDQVSVKDEVSLDGTAGDLGLKISHNIDGLDWTFFGMNYLDRMPYYQVAEFSTTPPRLVLQEKQARIQSIGTTLTYDLSGWLFRAEVMHSSGRRMNTLEVNATTQIATTQTASVNEFVSVLGIDLPSFSRWRISFQGSNSNVSSLSSSLLLRGKSETLLAMRVGREFNTSDVELMYHFTPEDSSSFLSGRWVFARSSSIEYLFGFEALLGKTESQFGSIRDASRVMVGLKGAFGG